MSKGKRQSKRPKKAVKEIPPPATQKPLTLWQKAWKILKKWYVIAGIIFGLLGWYVTSNDLYSKWFSSDEERFEKDFFINGIFAPFETRQKIKISYGTGSLNVEVPMPKNGVDLSDNVFSGGCATTRPTKELEFKLKIKNDIFLLSTTVLDFKTKEIIVEIVDNQIRLTKDRINRLYREKRLFSDIRALEVKDRYGNIAFRMSVDTANTVQIRGYFIGDLCTYFANDSGVLEYVDNTDSSYIVKATEQAAKLKPMFLK